jgi:serine/threonine-protein kinase HipA
VDYNDIGASSYEEYLRAVLRLGMAYPALEQSWLRMAFNVLAVNQDDHVKNLSFHMDRAGAWRLAPAYDITFAKGGRWTRTHQMRVRDKLTGITRADLMAVADAFGVKKPGRPLERIQDVLARWEVYAKEYDVPPDAVEDVRRELGQRAAELAA